MAPTLTRYVAFLRAINVGGHTVRMEDLRRLFAKAGATNVETFIASGNVIFDAPGARAALEVRMEAAMESALGFPVVTFLRTLPEVAAVAEVPACSPADLASAAHGALYVGFLKTAPSETVRQAVAASSTASHRFVVHDREVYWLRLNMDEEFKGPKTDKLLGPSTFRNITTIRKITTRYGATVPQTPRKASPRSRT